MVAAGLALTAGLVFGAVVQRSQFCTMGAVADLVFFGDGHRLRIWILAIGVALIGTQLFGLAGLVDLGASRYRSGDLAWFAIIVGGLLFGVGMTLAGGCSSRILVRFGAGNLKSLTVLLVMAIFAYMTSDGLFAPLRAGLESIGSLADGADVLVMLLDGPTTAVLALVIGVWLVVICFKDRRFRTSGEAMAAGVIIGALVAIGWAITGLFGGRANMGERADIASNTSPVPMSFTFVDPLGEGLVALLGDPGTLIGFGAASIAGVILGGFLMAWSRGEWRLEVFVDARDIIRHLLGAVMMGVGGVLALGCTIGQGVTGLSTLAAGSILAFFSIIAGTVFGLRLLEHDGIRGWWRHLRSRDAAPAKGTGA